MILESVIVVGVVASLGGLLVSTVVGEGLLIGRNAVGSGVRVDRLIVAPTTVLVGVFAGTLFTVIASLLPAARGRNLADRRAAHDHAVGGHFRSPAAADHRRGAGRGRWAAHALRHRAGAGFSGVPIVFLGAIAVFAGIVIAAPLIVSRLTAWAGWLPAKLFAGAAGRLAVTNALRNPKRVAATTSALMVGLALMSVFSVLLATARPRPAEQELDENFAVDYVISGVYTPGGAEPEGAPGGDRDPALRSELAAVAGARSRSGDVGGRVTEIWSMEPGALDTVLRPRSPRASPARSKPAQSPSTGSSPTRSARRVGSEVQVRTLTLTVRAV